MKQILVLSLILCLLCSLQNALAQTTVPIWSLSFSELSKKLQDGSLSAKTVAESYLERIRRIDQSGPTLRAVIELNPDALSIARELDRIHAATGPTGPLHGLPVILKANIDTGDKMATSAGSVALADHKSSQDAYLVKQLRQAGAIVLAKANLSEWANFRSRFSSSGWSSLGGQTRNPYATDRNPCGSSSGSAVAVSARLAPLAVGTETDGSIVCPAAINGVVGIKPTVGLISRQGIIPISHTQDTAGPMALTVAAAAAMLEAMAGPHEADTATSTQQIPAQGYLPDPKIKDLKGMRIGVWRGHFGIEDKPRVGGIVDHSAELLQQLGATIVEDISFDLSGVGDAEYEVLLYEFKAGLNEYLQSHDVGASVNSLQAIIEFNRKHAESAMPIFGQDTMELSQSKPGLEDPVYLKALQNSHIKTRREIDRVLSEHNLDAIIAAANAPAWKTDWINGDLFQLASSRLAAVSGYPSVAVPAGAIEGLPVAIVIAGAAYSERQLIQIAHLFERVADARIEPGFHNRLPLETSAR